MSGWRIVKLSEVATIERSGVQPEQIEDGTRYVGLEHIEKGGRVLGLNSVDAGELASSKFQFSKQHILYGKLRPYLAKIACPEFSGICSTDILPILPSSSIDRKFLFHFLRQQKMVDYANSQSVGANLPRLNPSVLANFELPLPPLEEQKRIAEILDRAESLRAMRRQSIEQLNTLTQAIFLEMFGDPVINPKGWAVKSLIDACYCQSGGTPSKSNEAYWQGLLPWFSAKDLKSNDLFDSQDHISEDIPNKTTLKLLPANTVVILVRGMMLAHTFPISVLRIPATIN